MNRIDAHQHFWQYHPERDRWITDDMAVIQRDFLPVDLRPLLTENGLSGCVAVQAGQSEAETMFLLDLAAENPFIAGVVGWVDLQEKDVGERVAYFSQFGRLKGFRHIVQGEEDPGFLSRPEFLRGIRALGNHHYTYDLLIRPHQLEAAIAFVRQFPDQPFVIDHLAKPFIKSGEKEPWASQIKALAQHENVYCKLSGLVTEADWNHWQPQDFSFYIQHAVEVFGPQRLMFGSDWPVCLLAAPYDGVVSLLADEIASLSIDEKAAIWGGTAGRFYGL